MRDIELCYVNHQNNTEEQMGKIVTSFFNTSRIDQNEDTEKMMLFLLSPESIYKMKIAADFELPALTFIVRELEDLFGDCSKAPLNHKGQYQNAVNRQNIGRMIRYIMREFGYSPIDGKLSERARIPKFAGSKYFSTSAVYAKNNKD